MLRPCWGRIVSVLGKNNKIDKKKILKIRGVDTAILVVSMILGPQKVYHTNQLDPQLRQGAVPL